MNYPIVSYPEYFDIIREKEIPVSPPPAEPIKPHKGKNNFGGFIIFGTFLCIFELFIPPIPLEACLVTIILFIIFDLISWLNSVSKNSRIYYEELNQYHNDFKDYLYALHNYNQMVSSVRNIKDTMIYRKEQLVAYIEETKKPTQVSPNPKKGIAEKYFYTYLCKHFPDKIFVDYILGKFKNGEAYTPDFIYQDKETNLHIDIEVDEPYILNSHKPIHYMEKDNHSDSDRDSYFNSFHWIVIRFSESQVVQYPNECCNYISLIIEKISTGEFDIPEPISLPKIKCWDYSTALKLGENYSRSEYLKKCSAFSNISITNNKISLDKTPNFKDNNEKLEEGYYDFPF